MSGKSQKPPRRPTVPETASPTRNESSKAPGGAGSNAWVMQWLKDYAVDPKATKTTPGLTSASSTESSLSLLKDGNLAPKASQTSVHKNKNASKQWTESSRGLGASANGVGLDLSSSDVHVHGKGRRDKPDGRTFTTSKHSTTGGSR
jgi:hypothetical protein